MPLAPVRLRWALMAAAVAAATAALWLWDLPWAALAVALVALARHWHGRRSPAWLGVSGAVAVVVLTSPLSAGGWITAGLPRVTLHPTASVAAVSRPDAELQLITDEAGPPPGTRSVHVENVTTPTSAVRWVTYAVVAPDGPTLAPWLARVASAAGCTTEIATRGHVPAPGWTAGCLRPDLLQAQVEAVPAGAAWQVTLIVDRSGRADPQTARLDLGRWVASLPAPPNARPLRGEGPRPIRIGRWWISEDHDVAATARWAASMASAAGCWDSMRTSVDLELKEIAVYDFKLTCVMVRDGRSHVAVIETVVCPDGYRRTWIAVG